MLRKASKALELEHAALAADVLDGKRFFWLGSGISRDQVPDLVALLERALLFLRDRAFGGDEQETHRDALRRVIKTYMAEEQSRLEESGANWRPADLEPLRDSYSEVLSTRVDGKPSDYLLMEGADLANTYGAPELQPGPCHRFLAILIFEGVLTEIASGNWDGLVEKAVLELTDNADLLDVYVAADDSRDVNGSAQIAKFHGCAVRARADPERYSKKIIATRAQISRFDKDADFDHMRALLKARTVRYRSLVLGLSVQDSDLLNVFTTAAETQPWLWDLDHPAYVFAEPKITNTQEDVLENCYRDDFESHRTLIDNRSAFGFYAQPLLAALVLRVLLSKLLEVLARQDVVSAETAKELTHGIARVGRLVATALGDNDLELFKLLTGPYPALLREYYGSRHFPENSKYISLARGTRAHIASDPSVTISGADRFALAVAFLGWGDLKHIWHTRLAMINGRHAIALTRHSKDQAVVVALVRGAVEADSVLSTDAWMTGSHCMTMLYMEDRPRVATRSSAMRLGAGRRTGPRNEICWSDIAEQVSGVDEVVQRFRVGAGL